MNAFDLTNFFFNLIPGSMFLIGLRLLGITFLPTILNNKYNQVLDYGLYILLFIIFALFIGFFLQGWTKIFRDIFLNRTCFYFVRKFNKKQYGCAEKILTSSINNIGEINEKDVFFLMDNYLRANVNAFNPIHFSSRFALWSNILIGAFVYILISLFYLQIDNIGIILFSSIIIFLFSLVQSLLHFYAYYDVILKTFITTISFSRIKDK